MRSIAPASLLVGGCSLRQRRVVVDDVEFVDANAVVLLKWK